jgi:hypothetical protein
MHNKFKREKCKGVDPLGLRIILKDNISLDVIMRDFALLIWFKRVNVVSFLINCKPLNDVRLLDSQPIDILSCFDTNSPSALILVGRHIICYERSTHVTVQVMMQQIEGQQQA